MDSVFLRRLYVLVFVELATRRVHLGGLTANPSGPWVTQRARELVEGFAGFRFLIRDTKFSASFDAVFRAEGIEVIRIPIRAPQANAICERAIGTIRRECLDRIITVGRNHLEALLNEYLHHYNGHRPHRSLDQWPPQGRSNNTRAAPEAPVIRRDRLGGLIHEYKSAA